jgi:hypothetical protein
MAAVSLHNRVDGGLVVRLELPVDAGGETGPRRQQPTAAMVATRMLRPRIDRGPPKGGPYGWLAYDCLTTTTLTRQAASASAAGSSASARTSATEATTWKVI